MHKKQENYTSRKSAKRNQIKSGKTSVCTCIIVAPEEKEGEVVQSAQAPQPPRLQPGPNHSSSGSGGFFKESDLDLAPISDRIQNY